MGSLFSPSVPQYSPVIYQPPRVEAPGFSFPDNKGDTNTAQTSSGQKEKIEDEDNIRDLIRRNARGRNSLIQTSYRGVLTDMNSLVPQRKNLLGE